MGKWGSATFCLGISVLALIGEASSPSSAGGAPAGTTESRPDFRVKADIREAFSRLALSFEPNWGQIENPVTRQAAAEVRFISRGSAATLLLAPTAIDLVLEARKGRGHAVLRIEFAAVNASATIEALDLVSGVSHYFFGDDPGKWLTGVPRYARIRYREIYPGIDLIFYGKQQQLEFDLVVHPGADPGAIRLAFRGAGRVRLGAAGDLRVPLPAGGGEVRLRRPLVYQQSGSGRRAIEGHYVLKGNGQIGFQVREYDSTRTLVIDPVLSFSTYLGGSKYDRGFAIAVDSAGNAYVTGSTTSADFPKTEWFFPSPAGGIFYGDAFVTKLNPTGTGLIYSTYLGGKGDDQARSIAVDSKGNAYVAGSTTSTDFPRTSSAFQYSNRGGTDAFVTKLDPAGWLLYSTYLGGRGEDDGLGIAVDGSGYVYVTGDTTSTDFPITGLGFQIQPGGNSMEDAFVAKLDPTGSLLLYSTYLGGRESDAGRNIAVDAAGNAYVMGSTTSPNFPTTAKAFQKIYRGGSLGGDVFIAKLNATGDALLYSTYLGGAANDQGRGIAIDSSGNAYVTGYTNSPDFPTTAGAVQAVYSGRNNDGFAAKISSDGSRLVYSTYLGGKGDDQAQGIAVDAGGRAYVVGITASADFPATPLASSQKPEVGSKVFVAKLDEAGASFVYSVLMGGRGIDQGLAIALGPPGSAYVTGNTFSSDFPTTAGAVRTAFGGGLDAFVAKIVEVAPQVGAAVNGADFKGPCVAGAIISIFGQGLALSTRTAGSVPLPTVLVGTRVVLDGLDLPLFYVSPGQINAQVPFETAGKSAASLQVFAGGIASAPLQVPLVSVAPRVFTASQVQPAAAAALRAADFTPVTPANPVMRNEAVILFTTGLGSVSPAAATGAAAPSSPLALTVLKPSVSIDGKNAPVLFSGLAPGLVGLYQINVTVPADSLTGDQVPVVVSAGGASSNSATLAIK